MAKKRTTSTKPPKRKVRKSKSGKLKSFDDIQVVGDQLFHTDAAEVDRLEKELRTILPTGYREFMTRFGEGVLANFVRVYPPDELLSGGLSVAKWRERIRECWFWDAGKSVLTKARALKCVLVADTLNGDELVFHPSAPDRLYVLPHEDEDIHVIEGGLLAALRWLLDSGTLDKPIASHKFEPYDSTAPRAPVPTPVAVTPDDLVAVTPIHERDGSVLWRAYRFGPDHVKYDWDGRSPLPTDLSTLIANALRAGDAQWGQPTRIEKIKFEADPPHFEVRCVPADGAWDDRSLFKDTVYLDLAGTVIVPEERLFKTRKAYQKYSDEFFGRG